MTAATVAMPRTRLNSLPWRMIVVMLVALVVAYAIIAIPSGAQATEQFTNALTGGALYALIALGYTMVYGIIELINFAHGEVFMVGSFLSYGLITGVVSKVVSVSGAITDLPLLILVMLFLFVVAMLVTGTLGVIIERFAYRPLRNAPRLAPLITAIGVSFILQYTIFNAVSNSIVSVPKLIPFTPLNFGFFSIREINLFVIVFAIALMLGLQFFTTKTRLGTAMRSTAMDREAAQLMGVDINRTIAITFFVGAALAGAAGVVQTQYIGNTVFNLGFQAGLFAFTAAVLGGIGNTTGAALGGFVIGFLQVIASVYGYGRWTEAFVFAALVLVLIFRPTGILGQQLAERA